MFPNSIPEILVWAFLFTFKFLAIIVGTFAAVAVFVVGISGTYYAGRWAIDAARKPRP